MYRARILRRPRFRAASSSWLSGRHPQYSSEISRNKSDTGNTIPERHEAPYVRPQGITSDEANKSLTIDVKTASRFSRSGDSHLSSSFSILQPSFITSESDGELGLLDQDETVETIGEHELKTSPLVTKDVIACSEQFSQRGLLGSVLSVHATGLPRKTTDPRIYLNLDAPSSGLVCGVQGSGKSHTVSCILESSLIANQRIGSLPVPLSPVVFHFDEENGGRPCEAAYLSEIQGGTGIGVSEVVVLVSPSNLGARRRVYSTLKFVRVEPLRIAEQDLNASRMLSMMGADNLETLPLYMHTSLSILREMGSDNFNYRDFRKRLKHPKFDGSQSAMLELRLDLLDSFLQGNGPDVKSFFKPSRLVILDISDPFMESTTAAMLFDICLGLFMEWKSSKGKLIVLDEAHKYLTNADANRFTRSICNIIRQQRHLAARVIVSTQEPTVVPASVLDLLSWIICHRFSSPGWVNHLKRHICVEEEKKDGHSEWGRRVMTLRTGVALLYSPASLFVTEAGELATLSAGYAIIKTRSRLTADGGASLLVTEAHFEADLEFQTGPPSLKLSEISPASHSSPRYPLPMIQPSTPIIDPVASSSVNYSPQDRPDLGAAPKSPAAFSQSLNRSPTYPPPIQTPQKATQPPSAKSVLPDAPSISIEVTNKTRTGSLYSVLIQVLRTFHQAGVSQPEKSRVGSELAKRKPSLYTGKLTKYLEDAVAAGVITLTRKNNEQMVTLVEAYQGPDTFPAPSPQTSSPTAKSGSSPDLVPPVITALLSAIATLSGSPKASASMSDLAVALKQHKDGDFKKAGYPRLKRLVEAAVERGLVTLTQTRGGDIVKATQLPSAKSILPDAPSISIEVTNKPSAGSLYSALIQVLRTFHQAGVSQPEKSKVGSELAKRKPSVYTGKLTKYLEDAVAAGVITLTRKNNEQMVTLVEAYQGPDTFPAPRPQASSTTPKSGSVPDVVPPVITALLSIIAKLSESSKGCTSMSAVSVALKQHKDGDFKKAGYPRLKGLIDAATERGLISHSHAGGRDIVKML